MIRISSRDNNRFPVLNPPEGFPRYVKWDALNEDWAKKIHQQDLGKLASRGGLSVDEIVMNTQRRPYYERGVNGVKPLVRSILEPTWARYHNVKPTSEELEYRDELLNIIKSIEA